MIKNRKIGLNKRKNCLAHEKIGFGKMSTAFLSGYSLMAQGIIVVKRIWKRKSFVTAGKTWVVNIKY